MLTSFAGSSLFGESYGTGKPSVLALHGWRRDHHDFDGVLSPPGMDAIALDLPGFGSAPAPEAVWGTPEYAAAVSAVFGEMTEDVVVLGHSFGGRVAVHLAEMCPERIAGLVLTGVPLYRPSGRRVKPPLRLRMARGLAAHGLVDQAQVEALRQRYGSDDYRAASGVMRGVLVRTLTEDYAEAIAAVRCRVELVWGDDDTAAPLAVAERAEGALADAHLAVCRGAGHLTPLTVPGELRSAIERLRAQT
ncbi:MAG: alpha/beta hydrolase [Acidimicrobiales bacterium]|jgi:pimeloyl-ACP methyl ester carboxylesterase